MMSVWRREMIKTLLLTKHNCKWHSLMDFCNITITATIKRKENKKNDFTLAVSLSLSLSLSSTFTLACVRFKLFMGPSYYASSMVLYFNFNTKPWLLMYTYFKHLHILTLINLYVCMHVQGYVKQLLLELISIWVWVWLCTHQTLSNLLTSHQFTCKFSTLTPLFCKN